MPRNNDRWLRACWGHERASLIDIRGADWGGFRERWIWASVETIPGTSGNDSVKTSLGAKALEMFDITRPDDPTRIAADDGAFRDRLGDDRPGADNRAVPNSYSRENGYAIAKPDKAADHNPLRNDAVPVRDGITAIEIVVLGYDRQVLAGVQIVADEYRAGPENPRKGVKIA